MSMINEISHDVNGVLRTFGNFHKFLRANFNVSGYTTEDIKTYFKTSHFIEHASRKIVSEDCFCSFSDTLKFCMNLEAFPSHYYANACDQVLIKFLTSSNASSNLLDVCIRVYMKLHPNVEHLENVIADVILKSSSYTILNEFCRIVDTQESLGSDLEARFLYESWSQKLRNGQVVDVIEKISSLLSTFKVQNSLNLVLKMFTFENEDLNTIISDHLNPKMMDRSLITNKFWVTIFKNVDKSVIIKVAMKNAQFRSHLNSFIVYLSNFMSDYSQTNTHFLVYSEISLSDLSDMIKSLCTNAQMREDLKKHMESGYINNSSLIWQYVNC